MAVIRLMLSIWSSRRSPVSDFPVRLPIPIPCNVPLGVVVFPYDLVLPVRRLVEGQYNIVHWSEWDRGGHFAAMEVPDL